MRDTQYLTDWYPAHIKPVWIGYYHTMNGETESHHNWYWDGTQWCVYSPEDWEKSTCFTSNICECQDRIWRGRTTPFTDSTSTLSTYTIGQKA